MRDWHLDNSEIRQLIALARLIYQPAPDIQLRWRELLAGASDLVRSVSGIAATISFASPAQRINVLARTGESEVARTFLEHWLKQRSQDEPSSRLIKMLDSGQARLSSNRSRVAPHKTGSLQFSHDCIYSLLPLDGQSAGMLCFCPPRSRKSFAISEAKLVELLHSEMRCLYLSPAARPGMTPRQREIHQCLLKGYAEKQIASVMGLSRHTVHAHVKAIYKYFHVSSRPELLARFVHE